MGSAISKLHDVIQLSPQDRISGSIVEDVDVPLPQFPASVACSTSVFSPPGGVATCGAEFARQVEISTLGSHLWLCRVSVGLKSTLRAHQMAPPSRQSSANLSTRQASRKGAGGFRSTETRRDRSTGVAGTATLWWPGQALFTTTIVRQTTDSLQRKPEPRFEPSSNQASTLAAQAKRRSSPCTSLASATSFLASTTWTTLSRATPCPEIRV